MKAPSIFLSCTCGDNEAFVKHLHADLSAAGFTAWFDRESLMACGLEFHQEIKDAIRTELDRVVYVGWPKAAPSDFPVVEQKRGDMKTIKPFPRKRYRN